MRNYPTHRLLLARLALLLLLALALAGSLALPPERGQALATNTPQPTQTPLPFAGGLLAFTSEREGMRRIYLINPDGSGLRRLTTSDFEEAYPAWSPDGTQLAFQARARAGAEVVPGAWTLAVADVAAGSALLLLPGERPAWSPDGTQLVFQRGAVGSTGLLLLALSSGMERPLTGGVVEAREPAWSPDGRSIAYRARLPGEVWQVWLVNADGTTPRALTAFASDAGAFAWSPDGTQLAVERAGDILLVNVADGSQRHLTGSAAYDQTPAWSPTGSDLVFAAGWDLFRVAAVGSSAARNLTAHPDYDLFPAWSPDGAQIAFQSYREGNWEIYVMDADSCNLRRLTDERARDVEPLWRPGAPGVQVAQRPPTAIISGTDSVVLRAGPGTQFAALGGANARDCLPVTGRTPSGEWLQVQTADGRTAWISAEFADIVGALDAVPLVGG